MADAYDALVFLAPLESLRPSATMPGLYAADFVPELARRYVLQRAEEELAAELVARTFVEEPGRPVPAVEER